jgi:5-bromo-4-chloroindolyl phosphate hydrolysis protein
MKKMNMIGKPISEKINKERTMRKDTTRNLNAMQKSQSINLQNPSMDDLDNVDHELTLIKLNNGTRNELNQTMYSVKLKAKH